MSSEHDHDHEPHPAPMTPDDAGSQALAEALRSSFAIIKVAMLLMVLAFFCSGFFTVRSQEKAVILRFGRPVGEGQKALLGAGLHWSYPYPIDVYKRQAFWRDAKPCRHHLQGTGRGKGGRARKVDGGARRADWQGGRRPVDD